MSVKRDHDVVVYGATSFVGQILCSYLVRRHGTEGDLRWAIAGRSSSKLDEVARATGADVPRIIADASDRAALDAITASTRVVVSTVGPYALHGSELVASVVEADLHWEDRPRRPFRLFYASREGQSPLRPDPNAFLLAALIPAWAAGAGRPGPAPRRRHR